MSVVLVPPPGRPPAGGVVLHRYAGGAVLVRVVTRAGEEDGPASPGGVILPRARSQMARARAAAAWVLGDPSPEEGPLGTGFVAEEVVDRGSMLAYVELLGPPDARITAALEAAGLYLVTFQPVAAYLCRGTPDAYRRARELPFVAGVVALLPELKPAAGPATEEGPWELVVTVAAAPREEDRLLAAIGDVAGLVTVPGSYEVVPCGFRVRVVIARERTVADRLTRLPFVLSVDPVHERVPEDEVADLVLAGQLDDDGRPTGRYDDWLAAAGYRGRGVTVGVVDDGVDPSHAAFAGRIVNRHPAVASHGTMVAGQVAGDYRLEQDTDGYFYGVGVAPGAELLVQDNSRNITALAQETATGGGPSGWPASVQNNSWGTATRDPMDYGPDEALLDGLVRSALPGADPAVPLTICFSAGNRGSEGLTRPKAAKNIIVVGNSENYRPRVGGSDADDVDDVFGGATGSSVGNCGDGRVRPDVLAPGQWTASSNYGVTSADERYVSPAIRYGGGTSAASPKIAGACAILTEWWRDRAGVTPSPAMLKAILVNSAADTGAGGPIPNMVQGWGRASLGAALATGRARHYVDQEVLLDDPGRRHDVRIDVADPAEPVCVTLAWTDPPGPVGSGTADVPAVVNRLLLTVLTESGDIYWGNEFADGWSAAAREPDDTRKGIDNLQNVFLPAGVAGARCTVSVVAWSVSTNCLTNRPGNPQQDFALVVDNARAADGTRIEDTPSEVVRRPAAAAPTLARGGQRVVAELLPVRPQPLSRTRIARGTVVRFPPASMRKRTDDPGVPDLPDIPEIPVTPVDPPPEDVVPVSVGDTLLLVDRRGRRIHHLLLGPALVSAAVTVQRTPADLRAIGGNVSLMVRCHGTPDAALWAGPGGAWSDALAAAGLGGGPWTAVPLELRTLAGDLALPAGHLGAPATVTANADAGLVSFLAQLTAQGARDWQRAIEERQTATLTGVCRLDLTALTRRADSSVSGTRSESQSAPLSQVLASLDPAQLRYVDPRTSVEAKVVITPYDGVQSVLFEARVRGSATGVAEVLGPEGGEVPLVVTSEDLAAEAVDWSAVITFAARSWPPIRLTGVLGSGSWTTSVSPGSWVRSLSIFSSFLGADGRIVPVGPSDVVAAEIRYEAAFLDGGVLSRSFALDGDGLVSVDYPSPPGAGAATLRLTVRVARDGQVTMTTRALSPADTMVQVLVAPDAGVTIRTNADPAPEEAAGPDAVRDLALPPRTPEESMRPMISGPARWPAASEPPSFAVMTGDSPFWAVELTTDASLVTAESAPLRTDANYWWDGLFRSGDTFVVPQEAWDLLGVSGRVFYRVFSSSQDTGWADWAVSTDDSEVASMPSVVVGDGPPAGNHSSPSADADVAALCGYLGVARDDFAAGQDRYFARLGELLAFQGVTGNPDDVIPATFRELVRLFQTARGLTADGIPGEDTLWELNAEWSDARRLTLERVPMDRWTPPGVAVHDDDRHGYPVMRVRSDVADAVTALRAELNLHGVLMTTSGAARALDAAVTVGRSSTSIHYSAAAFDLATVSGMTRDFPAADATNQLYVVTRDGTRWRVWARSASGEAQTLDAVEWRTGATSTRTVSGTFIDVTAVCAAHGFRPIAPRSSFPGDYLSAEWWHFQNEDVLVPWASQFGTEILALDSVDLSDLQAQSGIWSNRKRIFQRGRDGWW